jgi:hypothetical protein
MAWSRRFDDPIALPSGRQLVTLEEAARYIQKLPKAEQEREHWRIAVATLIDCAEGRDFLLHARVAVLRALNHGKPNPELVPRQKQAKAYRIIR